MSAPPLHILLVEDHEDSARALQILLREQGMNVQVAEDTQSALRLAAAADFDLLLADIRLPDGNGLELLGKLRGKGRSNGLKGISISALAFPRDIEASRAAGYLAHVTKPIEIEALMKVIERVCGG